LLDFALQKDQSGKLQCRLADDIFHAYFTDGLYPDAQTLASLGKKVGLDPAEVKKVVTDSAKLEAVHEAAKEWSRQGVSGVPYFIINGQKAFSGAQDVSTFVRMFDIIAEKYPLESRATDEKADSKPGSGL
jgi:predicted DsbA family dithiol-disulfide isomerase